MKINLIEQSTALLLTICLAASLIIFQGCTASRNFPNNTAQVVINTGQKITFEGKQVTVEKLPSRLKSAGASPGTIIRILIQKNTTQKMMKDIGRALATNGYRNFTFTMPKQAEAFAADQPGK